MDPRKGLGIKSEQQLKGPHVVSGREGISRVLRLPGGRNAMIQTDLMVLKNKDRRYLIRSLDYKMPVVAYRTGPKGRMDLEAIPQWLEYTDVLWKPLNVRKRALFVEKCSGHKVTEAVPAALDKLNTEVLYFPKNSTDLVQPCDSDIFQNIKTG